MSVTISTPDRQFAPSAARIAAGGTVTWLIVERDHEIVFTGAAPPGGNPGEVEEGTTVSRTFPEPGTYAFHCERHVDRGMRGTIVVDGAPPVGGGTGGGGSAATVSTPGATFSPGTVTIAAGGTVTWSISGARHNVTFRGAAPAGGSIPDTESASASRTFTTPGTYDYECTRHSGMTGRVVVQ